MMTMQARQETGQTKRIRSSPYDNQVVAYLIKLWEIFDRPCGQRLSPMIYSELDRLRRCGEIMISDSLADKLKSVSSRTIDTKLKKLYESLNPAALKRAIEIHQDRLYQVYLKKQSKQQTLARKKVENFKKLTPRLATFLIVEPIKVEQHKLVA